MNPDQQQKLQEENQRLKNVIQELSLLNELSLAMSSTIEVQQIMAKIITKSIKTVGAVQGTIMLIEEDSEVPMRTMIRGVDDDHRGHIYKLGSHLIGWMIKHCQPLLVNDTSKDKRLQDLEFDQYGIHSILSVPMILRGKLIGVINLFNKRDGAPFKEHDQKLMSIIATQVGSFLANAQSFEQVQESREKLQKQTDHLQKEVGARYGFDGIIGTSRQIQEIKEEIRSIAESPASILIIGETGTGKELVAKTIHYNSDRKDKPFIDVNSAAIPENLVESEFFGIEEGVATGVKKRIGLFEQANGGTLFIDEIGDMSAASQAKILRVLEERKIRRVGSNHNINVDIRIIAATNKNLKEEIKMNTFREDLYYRLSVFEFDLPPLRARREDISLLIEHFVQIYANRMGKVIQGFTPEAEETLINYDWTGNIRELANVVERAVILTKNPQISIESLSRGISRDSEPKIPIGETFEEAINNFKRRIILKALRDSGDNKAEAARNLKISRGYLFRLLNQLQIK